MVANSIQEQTALNNASEAQQDYTVIFLDDGVTVYIESDELVIIL